MDELYVVVLEISAERDGYYVREKINEKVIMDSPVHRYDGFEFRILSADDEFVQALIYADNPYTTRVLGLNVDNAGKKVGVLFDSPVLIETDGGFAGVLCSYVFQVSRHYIDVNKMYTLLGADIKSRKLMIESYAGLRDKLLEQKRRMEFSEMMHYMERNKDLQSHTLRMVEHTKLYQENFVSKYEPMKAGRVSCEESMMLIVAKAYAEEGKHVAVLNSGNPIEPNGQIFKGSDTEEEKICRVSNLYEALISENTSEYYILNKEIFEKNQFNSMFLGTDRVLYSPAVMVMKDYVGYRPSWGMATEEYRETPYFVDVLTCSAPFFSGLGYILPDGDLEYLLKRRIRNIFEVAIENGVETFIIGAFGCGDFHNPASTVARAFKGVLSEKRYERAFEDVIFVIESKGENRSDIEAFKAI